MFSVCNWENFNILYLHSYVVASFGLIIEVSSISEVPQLF